MPTSSERYREPTFPGADLQDPHRGVGQVSLK